MSDAPDEVDLASPLPLLLPPALPPVPPSSWHDAATPDTRVKVVFVHAEGVTICIVVFWMERKLHM